MSTTFTEPAETHRTTGGTTWGYQRAHRRGTPAPGRARAHHEGPLERLQRQGPVRAERGVPVENCSKTTSQFGVWANIPRERYGNQHEGWIEEEEHHECQKSESDPMVLRRRVYFCMVCGNPLFVLLRLLCPCRSCRPSRTSPTTFVLASGT